MIFVIIALYATVIFYDLNTEINIMIVKFHRSAKAKHPSLAPWGGYLNFLSGFLDFIKIVY